MFNIRLASIADAETVLAIYAPFITDTAITFEYSSPSPDAFRQRMAAVMERFPWIIGEWNGRIIGYAYATSPFARAAYQWNADLSVYTRPDCGGHGFGACLYKVLLDILTAQGVHNAYGIITADNAKSIAMHERLGFHRMALFSRVGYKMGVWHDVVWMEKHLKQPEPGVPPEPLKSIADMADVLACIFRAYTLPDAAPC